MSGNPWKKRKDGEAREIAVKRISEPDEAIRMIPLEDAPDGGNRDENVREAVVVAEVRQFMQAQMLKHGVEVHWHGREEILAQIVSCEEWESAKALHNASKSDPEAPQGITGPEVLQDLRERLDAKLQGYRGQIDRKGQWE